MFFNTHKNHMKNTQKGAFVGKSVLRRVNS